MNKSFSSLLGVESQPNERQPKETGVSFSFLFFSDLRKDISASEKYRFMRDLTVFADQENFEAIYIPERHFSEFGAIYTNSAVIASYLIPQTRQIRFRTAGISMPLHHPAEIVEWWAVNDILSGGRVDLGFGSGWNKADFIYAPESYHDRKNITHQRIEQVRALWRGDSVAFAGPDGENFPITVYPRPIQQDLNIWLLVAQSDEGFRYAGANGYNVFTMLYGISLQDLGRKIKLYKEERRKNGFDPEGGTVSLMLHTMLHKTWNIVEQSAMAPFKEYIGTALQSHLQAGVVPGSDAQRDIDDSDREKILDYACRRYAKTGAIFGSVEDGVKVVDEAIGVGVDEIACLMDFGVDYDFVKSSLPFLKELVANYKS